MSSRSGLRVWAPLVGVAVLVLSGCAPRRAGRPPWVVTGIHPDYPATRYLAAGGEAAEPEQAKTAALKALKPRFDRLVQDAHKQARKDRGTAGWYHPLAVAPAPVPTSLKIGVSWHSTMSDRTAVLAVLDKHAEAALHLDQLKSACEQAKEFAKAGDQAMEQDRNPYLALQSYLGGLLALSQAACQQVVVTSLLGHEPPAACSSAADDLVQKIETLAAGISIQPVRGDRQRLLDNGTLPLPLVASVRLIGTGVPSPVPAVPLFFAAHGTDPIHTRSDQFGLATAEVIGVPPGPGSDEADEHAVEAALDAAAILADVGIEADDPRFAGLADKLRSNKASFSYLLPGEAATRVAVLITELLGGEQAGTSVVGEHLAVALQEQGFDVLDPRNTSGAFTAPASVQQAVAALRGHTDLVVFGTVRADVVQALAKGFVFAQAEGEVQLVATGSGKVITTVKHTVKGAGRDDIAALERALTSFAARLTKAVRGAIASGNKDASP